MTTPWAERNLWKTLCDAKAFQLHSACIIPHITRSYIVLTPDLKSTAWEKEDSIRADPVNLGATLSKGLEVIQWNMRVSFLNPFPAPIIYPKNDASFLCSFPNSMLQ